MTDIKYPNITVNLYGVDGNAFAIMGAVNRAIKANLGNEAAQPVIKEYMAEAMSGDYDKLLSTIMDHFDVTYTNPEFGDGEDEFTDEYDSNPT